MRGAIFFAQQRGTPTPTHSQVFPVRDSISTFAIMCALGDMVRVVSARLLNTAVSGSHHIPKEVYYVG